MSLGSKDIVFGFQILSFVWATVCLLSSLLLPLLGLMQALHVYRALHIVTLLPGVKSAFSAKL
jgi:hypothetical protein